MSNETNENTIHMSKIKFVKKEQCAWTDNYHYTIPFTCSSNVSDSDLAKRIETAFYSYRNQNRGNYPYKKLYVAKCATLDGVVRTGQTFGEIQVSEVFSIGD
jgi:hypothetical protein